MSTLFLANAQVVNQGTNYASHLGQTHARVWLEKKPERSKIIVKWTRKLNFSHETSILGLGGSVFFFIVLPRDSENFSQNDCSINWQVLAGSLEMFFSSEMEKREERRHVMQVDCKTKPASASRL